MSNPTIHQGSSGGSHRNGQYFQERRRGQMNELKNLLNNVINEPQSKKARDVVRKVIGYMTLGMDASPVFSEMCRASYTNDQVTKKMIYFYLTTYAEDNPDLAIMAVNTFKKDCKHTSSKVRGLALRNLCSFKSADYVNNALPTIRQLLHDFEPYVKKTAIMGVIKVFYHEPATIFQDESIKDSLSSLIRDTDPMVSINAVMALHQIHTSEGGIPLNSKLALYLFDRLKQYNQWQQVAVLDILYNYEPTQKESYEIMNILWDKLKHSSISLVLASIKIIIKLAKQNQDLFQTIVQKIKAPLLTLMTGNQNTGNFQISYVILTHIDYVISEMGGKKYYQKDFKYFYCRYDQPSYTKQIKIKILGKLANQYNLGDMLNELNDYVSDIDILIARKSIQILANIAISLPEVSKALVVNLVAFNRLEKIPIVNETVIAFYQILRKFPALFNDIKPSILENQSSINEPESIEAFVWILGTFAEHIEDAPYILEDYVNGQTQNLNGSFEDYPTSLKSILLTQTIQTFVKRAPETIGVLKKIFKLILQGDNECLILKDHAAFYYRALRDNAQQIKRGFYAMNSDMGSTKQQTWGNSAQDQFNNLSIIYKKKENKYIKNFEYFMSMRNKQLGLVQPNVDGEQQSEEEQQLLKLEQPSSQQKLQIGYNNPLQAADLQQVLTLTAEQFQDTWNGLAEFSQIILPLNPQNVQYLDQESVEDLFKMWHIFCIASAEDSSVLKFFMYGKHTDNQYICLQVQIDKIQNKFTLGTKANTPLLLEASAKYIVEFMSLNQFVIAE